MCVLRVSYVKKSLLVTSVLPLCLTTTTVTKCCYCVMFFCGSVWKKCRVVIDGSSSSGVVAVMLYEWVFFMATVAVAASVSVCL